MDLGELDVFPPFIHRALTSISSPHFSEFALRLFQGFDNNGNFGGRRTSWGTGWGVVDEDLYAHAARRDGFRFVIEIVPWESTMATVEALFPRMKAMGSLFVTWQPHKHWGLSQ